MNTYTVLPIMIALILSVILLPALNIYRVDARGLGTEHAHPWRAKASLFANALKTSITTRAWRRQAGISMLAFLFAPGAATLSEGRHAGEFLMGERPDGGSRDTITVLSGQNLKAGAVIGRVNKGVGRVSTPTVVGTGNGTVSQVYAGPDVEIGNYVLTNTSAVTNGGVFSLVTPSGKTLPALTLTVGAGASTVYTSRHINFTITDGSTDFALNDAFTFVVSTTAPVVIGTGNGTVSSITLGPDAIPGNYRVENIAAITNSGTFKIVSPDGDEVAVGTIVAGAGGTLVLANQRHLNLTITDGSTDFAVGDAFNIAVFNQLSGGKVVAWDPTTFDGRDDAVGVLLDNVDASSADQVGVIIARGATVMKGSLEWGATITSSQKESAYKDLAAVGIIAR